MDTEGIGLLKVLIQSTGLPENTVEKEVQRLVECHGMNAESLTLEDVRELLASYLQEVLVEAKANY